MTTVALPIFHPLAIVGREFAATLDGLHTVVIFGPDVDASAQVAIGVGDAVARTRRVVIADVTGGAAPLEELITSDDPHGISDCFAYGISLSKIGHPIGTGGLLFVLRSGTEPVLTEEILAHPRWPRLAAGFREMGALLILVVPLAAPGLETLMGRMEGVIVVGDAEYLGSTPVLGRVGLNPPRRRNTPRLAPVLDSPRPPVRSLRRPLAYAGLAAAVLVVLATVWVTGGHLDTSPRLEPLPPIPPAVVMSPPAEAPPPVENPGDSATAVPYGIEVLAVNTGAGALAELRRMPPLPAATAAPDVEANGVLWYKVIVGAYTTERAADSLLRALHAGGQLGTAIDRLVRLPYAFLLGAGLAPDGARHVTDSLTRSGIAAYALSQDDGTARVYAGAFATSEQAMLLAPELRAAGIQPRIVYRTGRPF